MKKNYCKIVFSDIDGTILTSDGVVTPGTKEMFPEMEKDGIPFVLTSARSPEGVRVIKRKIGNHAPMICFCGALILDQDERPLYSCQIPLDTAVELKHLLEKEFPEVCCNTFGFEKWIVDNREDAREQREEAIVGESFCRGRRNTQVFADGRAGADEASCCSPARSISESSGGSVECGVS